MNDADREPLGARTFDRPGGGPPPIVRYAIVAVVALLVGLGIGAAVWAGGDGDADDLGSDAGAVTTVTVVTGSTRVSPCLDSVEELERAADLFAEGASAISDLDGDELRRVIEELQDELPGLRDTVERCRDAVTD